MKNRTQKKTTGLNRSPEPPDLRTGSEIRAYRLWEASGGRHGNDLSHWLQAELELANHGRTRQEVTELSSTVPSGAATKSGTMS